MQSKPTSVNAAAISFCPFTPCSLRIAKVGFELRMSIFLGIEKLILGDSPN